MTPRDFCFWLHGFFELTNTKDLSQQQVIMIRLHLNSLFKNEAMQFGFDPDGADLLDEPEQQVTISC